MDQRYVTSAPGPGKRKPPKKPASSRPERWPSIRKTCRLPCFYLLDGDRKQAHLAGAAGIEMGRAESPLEIDLKRRSARARQYGLSPRQSVQRPCRSSKICKESWRACHLGRGRTRHVRRWCGRFVPT